MSSSAEYIPWSRIENIDVPVTGLYDQNGNKLSHIRVPYVHACHVEAVERTATIVAFAALQAMKLAQLIADGEHQDPGETQPWLPDKARRFMQREWDQSLVRFHCIACENEWDAWTDDQNKLQDVRDVLCRNKACPRYRRVGEPI